MKITKTIEITEDIICNKCKKSLRLPTSMDGIHNTLGLTNCTVSGGYGSLHLEDFTKYEFDLCEKCLRELFNSFKIPVKESPLD